MLKRTWAAAAVLALVTVAGCGGHGGDAGSGTSPATGLAGRSGSEAAAGVAETWVSGVPYETPSAATPATCLFLFSDGYFRFFPGPGTEPSVGTWQRAADRYRLVVTDSHLSFPKGVPLTGQVKGGRLVLWGAGRLQSRALILSPSGNVVPYMGWFDGKYAGDEAGYFWGTVDGAGRVSQGGLTGSSVSGSGTCSADGRLRVKYGTTTFTGQLSVRHGKLGGSGTWRSTDGSKGTWLMTGGAGSATGVMVSVQTPRLVAASGQPGARLVRLSFRPSGPMPGLTLKRYEVERSLDGGPWHHFTGTVGSGKPLQSTNVPGSATEFTDGDPIPAGAHQPRYYRIAAWIVDPFGHSTRYGWYLFKTVSP